MGCVETSATVISETCVLVSPITYSLLNDTDETIIQIIELNAVLDGLDCEG